jgi:hypothetical protein
MQQGARMKQVQKTIGRLVQRIAGKRRSEPSTQPAPQPTELDAKALRQVGGGVTPNKGW